MTEAKEPDEIDLIIAYESGELDANGMLNLFSKLVKNGMVWSLQGSYGRAAARLIEAGYLNKQGEILKSFEE